MSSTGPKGPEGPLGGKMRYESYVIVSYPQFEGNRVYFYAGPDKTHHETLLTRMICRMPNWQLGSLLQFLEEQEAKEIHGALASLIPELFEVVIIKYDSQEEPFLIQNFIPC